MIDFNSTVADLELDGGEQMDFFEAKWLLVRTRYLA